MSYSFHLDSLQNHIYSNKKRNGITFNLNAIEQLYLEGKLFIDDRDKLIFKKLIYRMNKFNSRYWIKENWEYKILYYSLCYLIKLHNS